MRRIVLLGCAGTGKTMLAEKVWARTGAPVICLDKIWRPEWGANDVSEFRAIVAAAHAGEAWISDGNFAQVTFDLRLPRAELIVWLERPRLVCAWRAVTRVFKPGEAHEARRLLGVLRFIWRFDRVNRPLIETLLREHGAVVPVLRLSSNKDVEMFLAGLSRAEAGRD